MIGLELLPAPRWGFQAEFSREWFSVYCEAQLLVPRGHEFYLPVSH